MINLKRIPLVLIVAALVMMFLLPTSYATLSDLVDVKEEEVSPVFQQKVREVQQHYYERCLQERQEAERRQAEDRRKKIEESRKECKRSSIADLFAEDWKTYKKILFILKNMIEPLMKKRCRGGDARVESVVGIMNDLVKIHKQETYCTPEKTRKLDRLLRRAKREKEELHNVLSLPFQVDFSGKMEPETRQFFQEFINQHCHAHTVGANLSAGFFVTGDIGLSGGVSRKDILGKRSAVVMAKYGCGVGFVLSGTVGYNLLDLEKKGTIISHPIIGPSGGEDMVVYTGGMGLGGSLGVRNYKCKPVSIDAGLSLGIAGANTGFIGKEIFSIGYDLKHFAKNCGLHPETGHYPELLSAQIESAFTKDDFKQIKQVIQKHKNTVRGTRKGYHEGIVVTTEEIVLVKDPS